MKKFAYLTNEMRFVEFVLSKARVLRVLYVTLDSRASCSNEDVVTDIAQHSRASPNAQAIFMGREPESANHQDKGFLTWTDEDSTEEEQANAARPRRRQRRNFESVAQMDQLEEEILKLAKKRDQIAMESLGVSKEINMILKEHRKQQNYNNSAVQLLCERNNINYHELLQRMSGRSPDHPGTSKPEGNSVGSIDGSSSTDNSSEDSPEGPYRP